MNDARTPVPSGAGGAVDAFLKKLAAMPQTRTQAAGRLIFALDATMSRQPTWDQACAIQADMFRETATLGGLSIQLVHFGGFGEFAATPWIGRSEELIRHMSGVSCRGGKTQIERVLRHALVEAKRGRVAALVYVGDACEEEADALARAAGELGLVGVPAFLFHEGGEPRAAAIFRDVARLSRGAYCPFDAGSARQLKELLSAVAVYAAGGRKALEDFGRRNGGGAARLLIGQVR
ncbi:MAG: VWA domain-containing protein [Alphaproteobacteria bacterium]|nr:VWA domain-containing protein [Alphaproteobacteria bacterium]